MKENNKSKFTLIDDSGVEREYEMLFTFDSDETKKSYMVYTDHDKDADGKEKVYASISKRSRQKYLPNRKWKRMANHL